MIENLIRISVKIGITTLKYPEPKVATGQDVTDLAANKNQSTVPIILLVCTITVFYITCWISSFTAIPLLKP